VSKYADIKRCTATEVHWKCRQEHPLILDARPKIEHNLYKIIGSINIPPDAKLEDYSDIPRDRGVYIFSDDADEVPALELAKKIVNLPHPDVQVVYGGPDEMRRNGLFFYTKDVDGWEKLEAEKKKAKEESERAANIAAGKS